MKEKKGTGLYTRLVSLLLCLAIAATLLPQVPFTLATGNPDADNVYHIWNFADLVGAVGYSRSSAGNTIKYVLEKDIAITQEDMNSFRALTGDKIKHISFGDREHYFLGEFDGKGHTISGLNYDNILLDPETRTGLFSFVGYSEYDGKEFDTYIHDLTLEGASIHADYCAGILAGDAYNTRFENIRIVNSQLSVNPADNALVLVTDGGAYGGAVAGYAENCVFYNCESKNTIVRANSVAGVAALSGKPLYMGGLVGEVQSSDIEYCRVMGGAVKNRYETSVGALGGFTCYSGGLAGQAGGLRGGVMENFPCRFIDSFATCDVSFHAATYVGVAAGCSGHAGGLIGRVKKDTLTTIKRCHYADGTISSYQYNTLLLMIPVQIADDVNRSGLVDMCDKDRLQVYNSYFNYLDTIGPKSGKPANVLGDKSTSAQYGPQPDERYEDRSFWENRGYDFAGNVDRSKEDGTKGPRRELQGDAYYNKWVMYYYTTSSGEVRGYPVHGQSVAATFDFPGAAKVTLQPTLGEDSLSRAGVSTEDPYRFAVLGIYPTECRPVTNGTETRGGVSLSIAMNDGYQLVNWYLEPDVAAAGLPDGQHEYFDRIFADSGKIQARLPVSNPSAGYANVEVADNQLYVARCQAQVVFHDLSGATLNKTDGAAEATPQLDDDWYFYGTPLPAVTPVVRPTGEGSESAKLIGWTTVRDTTANADGTVTPGWEQINATQLDELEKAGKFYETGDAIVSTLELYPVYANQLLNIHVEIEGYDIPAANPDGTQPEPDKTYRAAVGKTHVTHEGDVIKLRVESLAPLQGDATEETTDRFTLDFPDGYRFLGWYEDNHCVSRARDYTLPKTVDLNMEHTYQARFEYRVDYYAVVRDYKLDQLHGTPFDGPCAQVWQLYDTPFNDSKTLLPAEYHTSFEGWYKGNRTNPEDTDCSAVAVPEGERIKAPYQVHEHVKKAAAANYDVFVATDFPGSGVVSQTGTGAISNSLSVHVVPETNYNFLFWAGGRPSGNWHGTSGEPDWTPEGGIWLTDASAVYGFEAHMTANVIFHTKEGGEKAKVQRRYQERVFLDVNTPHNEYTYPTSDDNTIVDTTGLHNPDSEAFPFATDMTIPGYHFIGWIDKDDPDTQAALNDIYNVSGDLNTTTNVDLAKNYVLTAEDIVTRAMPNIYPVYAKYHIDTTTNVLMTVENVVQKPRDPIWEPNAPTEASAELTITASNNVPVKPGSNPGGETYTIEYITVAIDGGEPEKLPNPTDTAGDWVIRYTVVPGKEYLFTAVYKPYVVVYHQYENIDTEVLVRNYGDPIGRPAPPEGQDTAEPVLPTVQDAKDGSGSILFPELNHALFVGWTEVKPGNGLYHFSEAAGGKTSYELAQEVGFWGLAQTEDIIVTRSMELWPVFATYTVDVNSNIDQELLRDTTEYPNPQALWEKVRSLERTSANTVSTTVKAQEVPGYKFVGWYTGVKPDTNNEYNDFTDAVAVSESGTYTLEGHEPFTGQYYTARYKKVYKVIYHGRGRDGGPVIHTNYLYEGEDEDKALNKKITQEVEKPRLDENKGFVRDEKGDIIYDKVTTTYHQPLDPTPYHMIYATMDSNESFGQWECHNPNSAAITPGVDLVNIYEPWSFYPLLPQPNPSVHFPKEHNGYGGLIADVGLNERTINLYPTVWKVTVTDSNGIDISDQVDIDIDMSHMKSDYSDVKVYVCFDPTKPYTQSKLTVKVQRTRWVETADSTDPTKAGEPDIALRGRDGVEVIPYTDSTRKVQLANSETTIEMKDKAREDDPNTPENEADDGLGYAEFTFGEGLLEIQKDAPTASKDETFLFQVTDTADSAKSWQVAVTCDQDNKAIQDDGSLKVVGSRGSEILSLPAGTYSVTELTSWSAHMKAPLYQVYVGGALRKEDNAHLTVPLASAPAGAAKAATKVICTNQPLDTGPQWLWRTKRVKNLFNLPTS